MTYNKFFRTVLILLLALGAGVYAQPINHLQNVNPFIGTAKSNVLTKWGSEGGTYPGAVAPSGNVQLTPETRVNGARGYNYADSAIYYFSCFGHMSGFPEGSSGKFYVMPTPSGEKFEAGVSRQHFLHADEAASPGYYKVAFANRIKIEATASERTGFFNFSFPNHILPQIFIGDEGQLVAVNEKILHASTGNVVLNFTEPFTKKERINGGWLLTFGSGGQNGHTIGLKISRSSIDFKGAQNNIDQEIGSSSFAQLCNRAADQWRKKLSVIDVDDPNGQNKTVFYTALYHALLIPWVIDDADGRYRGADQKTYTKSGKNQYGAFSPWDTFRSLHPLLTLLYPDKQNDVILSMLDFYKQTGHLPVESMTGNHSIPIIVDSYLKGVTGFDQHLAYEAMKKSVLVPPFIQSDMEIYRKQGYVPFTRPESVTRTVEYAYDDWALAQFAKNVAGDQSVYQQLMNCVNNYRNLLNVDELLFLPRNGHQFKLNAGMSGYKEGDKWVYTYFVPHNAKDLINRLGGAEHFALRLDSALTNNVILFDNETVFHLPYLFNEAGKPTLTQKWCRKIMIDRFSATPGGLPGNDDLGATSSWYVFSAMGIFPACPGRPLYAIGAPMFNSVALHLPNGKTFLIKAANNQPENNYVQFVKLNGSVWKQLTLPHDLILKGGSMTFDMAAKSSIRQNLKELVVLSETKSAPNFNLFNSSVSRKKVNPNEPFTVYFSIKNTGADGVKVTNLLVNNKRYAKKNTLVPKGGVKNDSIVTRLFALGKTELKLAGMAAIMMKVTPPEKQPEHPYEIISIRAKPMLRLNEKQAIYYTIKNITGGTRTFHVPLLINNTSFFTDTITLAAGQKKDITHTFNCLSNGFQQLTIDGNKLTYKVYDRADESLLLDLSPVKYADSSKIVDRSGFHNNGHIIAGNAPTKGDFSFDEHHYIEVPNSPSVDLMDTTMTMMGWIYSTGDETGLVDLISKGDRHVLQVSDHKTLTFFAGGWGRGDCTVSLPANWKNNWHHLAGVCDGRKLYLYIDGKLAGTTLTESTENLSETSRWTLGRNEEFPGERIYHGRMDQVKVFSAALSSDDVSAIYKNSRGRFTADQ